MKIYHLSSAPFTGGAARAGFRLHRGLIAEPGVESVWLDPGAGAIGEGVLRINSRGQHGTVAARFRRRWWSSQVAKHFTPTAPPASNPIGWGSIEMLAKLPIPDVWNLHWVSWWLDWETMLPWMAERAPIAWTLHDLNPLKGIWHYEPEGSDKNSVRMRIEQKAMDLKRRALNYVPRDRLRFVAPSRWMVECCRESPVTREFAVHHIPYGICTETFAPRDPSLVRRMFDIPEKSFVLGFVADHIADYRKGLWCLQEALDQLPTAEIHLLTVGNGALDELGLPTTSIGSVQNDLFLSFIYSACDAFVCPSLQDNLPNTVIEAMACGTPVVGFRTGGIPDMIRQGETGIIVDSAGDAQGLASAIEALAGNSVDRKAMGKSSRNVALDAYAASIQGAAYVEIYSKLCSEEIPHI